MSRKNIFYWTIIGRGRNRKQLTIYLDGSVKIDENFLNKTIQLKGQMSDSEKPKVIDFLLEHGHLTKENVEQIFSQYH